MSGERAMTDPDDVADQLEELEGLVDAQRERIDELEAIVDGSDRSVAFSRRTALKAGGIAGLLALGSGVAGADPQGQVGTADEPINALYAAALDGPLTGGDRLESLVGDGLTIENGRLTNVIGVPELTISSVDVGDVYDVEAFTVDVTVAETAGVKTRGLRVELVVEDAGGTTVYEATIDDTELAGSSETVTFGTDGSSDELGPFAADDYRAMVTVDGTIAGPADAVERFTVERAFAGGEGTTDDPFQIETWHHLDHVRDFKSAAFVLVADLDETTDGYDAVASHDANDGEGFEPIGDVGEDFTGTFDGDGHVIEGMVIDREDQIGVGLFRDNMGTIESVGLVDVDVTGQNLVGALVGLNGLDGEVRDSYATGRVTGSETIGGLVGSNANTVTGSFATADVSGGSAVGGLAGNTIGTVNSAYATGDVDGDELVGGIVGAVVGSGDVRRSYATGVVSGDVDVGGIVGRSDNGSVASDVYWDHTNSPDLDATDGVGGDGGSGGTGLTTAEMQGDAPLPSVDDTMPGLDFADTWSTVTGPDDNPVLQAIDEDAQLEARG